LPDFQIAKSSRGNKQNSFGAQTVGTKILQTFAPQAKNFVVVLVPHAKIWRFLVDKVVQRSTPTFK
jgi:hypothetical protein